MASFTLRKRLGLGSRNAPAPVAWLTKYNKSVGIIATALVLGATASAARNDGGNMSDVPLGAVTGRSGRLLRAEDADYVDCEESSTRPCKMPDMASFKGDASPLAGELTSSNRAEGGTAGLYVLGIIEDPKGDSRAHYIQFEDGTIYELRNLPEKLDGNLASGRTRIVLPRNVAISEEDATVDMMGRRPEILPTAQIEPPKGVTGNRTVLAVRVHALDFQYTTDPAVLAEEIFGDGGVDSHNLKSGLERCSYDKLGIDKAPDRTGRTGANIANGVVTVSININAEDNEGAAMSAAIQQLRTEFEVANPAVLADHIMFCLPDEAMSGIAIAAYNFWWSRYKGDWCIKPSVAIHELGHNFGLNHANQGCTYDSDGTIIGSNCEYEDRSGHMGFSYFLDETPRMCFNAFNSWLLGWYEDKSVTIDPTAPDEENCYRGDLYGAAQYSQPEASKVLLGVDSASNTASYYITFNKQMGINIGTREGGNKVMVVRSVLATSQADTYYSELEAKLGVGESWSTAVQSRIVALHVDSIDPSSGGPARVRLEVDGAACGVADAPTTSPSKSPSASPPSPPTSSPTSGPSNSPSPPAPGPSKSPSASPTSSPTPGPSKSPTSAPTSGPSKPPSASPMSSPTTGPSKSPTSAPTSRPTKHPSASPTSSLTTGPSKSPSPPATGPSKSPSASPTSSPSTGPSKSPSPPATGPSKSPSASPTPSPTGGPSKSPTSAPTSAPSKSPSASPTSSPTGGPSESPTSTPTSGPSKSPLPPATGPSKSPSASPTSSPTTSPSKSPASAPTSAPSKSPSAPPTSTPTSGPSRSPSASVTSPPTASPSKSGNGPPASYPSSIPSRVPSETPTYPTSGPTNPSTSPTPSMSPSLSKSPSEPPSLSLSPTPGPTTSSTPPPTFTPSKSPTASPTFNPSLSKSPSIPPTYSASPSLSKYPSESPTSTASPSMSKTPSVLPTLSMGPTKPKYPTSTKRGKAKSSKAKSGKSGKSVKSFKRSKRSKSSKNSKRSKSSKIAKHKSDKAMSLVLKPEQITRMPFE